MKDGNIPNNTLYGEFIAATKLRYRVVCKRDMYEHTIYLNKGKNWPLTAPSGEVTCKSL